MFLTFLLNFIVLHTISAYPEIHIKNNGSFIGVAYISVAPFGQNIPFEGIEGFMSSCSVESSCTHLDSIQPIENFSYYPNHFLIVDSSVSCSLYQKAKVAERAGYSAIIIRNSLSDEPIKFFQTRGMKLNIIVASVGMNYGTFLYGIVDSQKFTVVLVLNEINFSSYGIQAILVFTIASAFALFFSTLRWFFMTIYGIIRKFLKLHLRKLPLRTFNKDDLVDVCSICLDDYKIGDKMRTLPCEHEFHSKCIDPWLSEDKYECPICKKDVRLVPEKNNPTLFLKFCQFFRCFSDSNATSISRNQTSNEIHLTTSENELHQPAEDICVNQDLHFIIVENNNESEQLIEK